MINGTIQIRLKFCLGIEKYNYLYSNLTNIISTHILVQIILCIFNFFYNRGDVFVYVFLYVFMLVSHSFEIEVNTICIIDLYF